MADSGPSRYPTRGLSNQTSKANTTKSTVGPNTSVEEGSVKTVGNRDALMKEFDQALSDGKSFE